MEEIRYCIFCGSPLSDGSRRCPVCKKEIPLKESLFREYLYKNTKESLKEKIDDTLFSAVKNWLLSHLYGLVVSIVLISLAGVLLVSPRFPSYITEMNSSSRPVEVSSTEAAQTDDFRLTSEDFEEITAVSDGFTDSVFYYTMTNNGEKEFSSGKYKDGPPLPPEAFYIPKEYDEYPVSSWYSVDTSYPHIMTVGGYDIWVKPTTEIGKTLHEDGYPIAEMEVTNTYKNELGDDAPAVRNDRFLFVLVKMDGKWYIAETKLISQEE